MTNYGKRKIKERKLKDKLLIVCQGKKTEFNYFEGMKNDLDLKDLKIITESVSPGEMVKYIENCIEYGKYREYNQIWFVFDKDDFENFEQAIQKAEKNRMNVAYSNSCFEV